MQRSHSVFCLPLLALLVSGTSNAPTMSPRQDIATMAVDKLTIEPGAYSVEDLIERSGKFLGRNYLVENLGKRVPSSAPIHIQRKLELGPEACEDVVSQILYTRDWVLTTLDRSRGVYEWVYRQGRRANEIIQRSEHLPADEILSRSTRYVHVTTSITLKNLQATQAQNCLNQLFSNGTRLCRFSCLSMPTVLRNGKWVSSPGGTIVMSGMAPMIAKALRILRDSDRAEAMARRTTQEVQK